ncbi:hypothetical protein V3C99_005400 [Haemonchus contortus]
MPSTHIFDLPPEIIIRILKELDEQSVGRLKVVSRYLNTIIQKHGSALAKQAVYLAVLREKELIVERFLRRNRWEDYKYAVSEWLTDTSVLRQLAYAKVDTLRFQLTLPEEDVVELARRIDALKLSVFQVCFSECKLSSKSITSLIAVLRPQQISIEFDPFFNGVTVEALCRDDSFREINTLNLVNSQMTDNSLGLITAEHLNVYETSRLTLKGLRHILLEWYSGKRNIQDYLLSITERFVPGRVFHGLPSRQRSVIAWELRNSTGVLHVTIIGPELSFVKFFGITKLNCLTTFTQKRS